MQQPEAKLKQKLRESFEKVSRGLGWYTYLASSMLQKRGLPDLVFGWPGGRGPVWIEGKVETPVSEIQQRTFTKMASTGFDIRILRWTANTVQLRGKYRTAELSRWCADGVQRDATIWSWTQFDQSWFWTSLFHIEVPA